MERHVFGEDCWVYELTGKNLSRSIMLMSRHDMVAAEGRWEHDPFGGEIIDGKLWGRRTVDTKTPLFAEFSALKELLLERWTPSCNGFLVSSSTWRFSPECGGGGVRPPPEPPGAGHVRPPSSPLQISHGLYNPDKRIPSLWTNAPGCDRLSSRKPGASRYDMSSPRRPSGTAEGTLRTGVGRLSIAQDL